MINLTPTQEKKAMIKSFYYRLATVSFIMLGAVMFLACAALLPSYFVSLAKKNSVLKKTGVPAEFAPADSEILAMAAVLDRELALLDRVQKNKFLVSERVINAIISKKTGDIKITEIYFDTTEAQTEAESRKISIKGTASSRERLQLFRKALADDPAFLKVDLPASNFIKGSNIEFGLSLTPA